MYTLTVVHNFININNPDDLSYFLKVQNEVIDKEDARFVEVESNVIMNQRCDEIAEFI